MAGLPPPPANDPPGSYAWVEWYRLLRQYISTASSIPWSVIQFAGSRLTDIAIRLHNTLQGMQGGQSGEYYHLTQAEYSALGTATVPDGDKGDITVSGSGTTWTIDNGAVTAAKTSITGTPNGTKYLRDDFSWQSVAGGSALWTEVEIDFGSTPVYDATFTITDAAITSSAVKMAVVPSGKAATGRTADDWQWDGGTFVANPGTGSAVCYATFHPGPIVGRRTLQYQIG